MTTLKRVPTIIFSIIFLTGLLPDFIAAQDRQVFMAVEEMPQLHGDLDSLHKQIQYPSEAIDSETEGRVILQFVVNKNGKAEDIKIIRGIGKGLDEEAKRLIKEANFNAGKQRGEPVNVQMSMPIRFSIDDAHQQDKKSKPDTSPDKSQDEIVQDKVEVQGDMNVDEPLPEPSEPQEEKEDFFVAVENMPELKGGLGELQKKLEYPDMARKAGIEGRVIVQFIVNEQGQVENPNIIRGIGGGCDEEALRVIKEEAEFEPGRQRGEPVRVQYSLPLTFQLQGDE